ncbi:hypothetical protein QUF74_05825 [Candidatus Halobeggiatoa sp. HSG11]|nr:hypothetical protein [Candidatus Halobeggiatoa sp. HSG11]
MKIHKKYKPVGWIGAKRKSTKTQKPTKPKTIFKPTISPDNNELLRCCGGFPLCFYPPYGSYFCDVVVDFRFASIHPTNNLKYINY